MKYVSTFIDRHGKRRWYYRREGLKQALSGDPLFPEHRHSYDEADADFTSGAMRARRQPGAIRRAMGFRRMIETMLVKARKRAAQKGREFKITHEWVEDLLVRQEFRCAVTGIPLATDRGPDGRNPYGPSLDRISSRDGYTPDNVRIVLLAVNCAISDWGVDTFDKICRAYVRNPSGRPVPSLACSGGNDG